MNALAEETIASAARFDHPWDEKAVDWPLGRDSVVVEVGGYKGRWARQILERYDPLMLFVFEPQPWAAAVCQEVLGVRAAIQPCALGDHDGMVAMGEWETDGCSIVKGGDHQVRMCEIGRLFPELGIMHIDLMLVNIEGYEYTLIPHMLDVGVLPQRLMVQFHTFADPSGVAAGDIFDRLATLGYRIAWSYGVVLTAWERSL